MRVKVKHAVHLSRSPDEVFAFISNPDYMPQWQSSLFEVTDKHQAQDGRLQRGTRVRDLRNVLGKKIDSQYEVADSEPGKRLVLRVVDGPVSFEMRWDLEPWEGGTLLTAEGGGDLGDLPLSAVAATRSCQHLLENDLTTLADILDDKGQAGT